MFAGYPRLNLILQPSREILSGNGFSVLFFFVLCIENQIVYVMLVVVVVVVVRHGPEIIPSFFLTLSNVPTLIKFIP